MIWSSSLSVISSLVIVASSFSPATPIRHGLPPRTLCLTFHDVIPSRTKDSLWFDCSVGELRTELDWLKAKSASFISVSQLYRHLAKGTALPPNPVCITFADNYLGFYTYAYPLLKSSHIPCAMFVHTGYVGSPIGRPKMDWSQLQQLDKEGLVTVASQTVSHPQDLRTLGPRTLAKEMVASKQELERRLGHPVLFLAYPNGKFDARCEKAAQAAGYVMAFSERLTPAESSPAIFAVSRYVHTKYKLGWSDCHRR